MLKAMVSKIGALSLELAAFIASRRLQLVNKLNGSHFPFASPVLLTVKVLA